jgi:hypothetical protein
MSHAVMVMERPILMENVQIAMERPTLMKNVQIAIDEAGAIEQRLLVAALPIKISGPFNMIVSVGA